MAPRPFGTAGAVRLPSSAHSSRLVYGIFTIVRQIPRLFHIDNQNHGGTYLAKRASEFDPHKPESIAFAVLIPILVLLSGVFAGLTLGYMSLDETQLSVLSISGTPKQREYAAKIMPVRKNGHLLLVTLLLANMIVNETLPVISDPVLGGGVQSVVVSTVLIVIFAEIIPQSIFTRHGLYLGAKCAGFTQCLIYAMGIISWPVAKLLEFALGPHHGIIYRRAELKELINMHASISHHGGDLAPDTVTIIGATLDLQEKVVRETMTPLKDVFMLSIEDKLDYDNLKLICETGHSRIPVYEEVDYPTSALSAYSKKLDMEKAPKLKKIIGILLVKHCVLLDPKESTPLRKIPLNKVPFVPQNESLLGMLDTFQEGGSHIAVVSRLTADKAASVKDAEEVVKRSLTQRLKSTMGISDSESESELDSNDVEANKPKRKGSAQKADNSRRSGSQFNEQDIPADAVLDEEGAKEFLQFIDPNIDPLGIITLEDVLEELIGEEIYDEFDSEGAHGDPINLQRSAAPSLLDGEPKLPPPVGDGVETTKGSTKHRRFRKFKFRRTRSEPTSARPALRQRSGDNGLPVAVEDVSRDPSDKIPTPAPTPVPEAAQQNTLQLPEPVHARDMAGIPARPSTSPSSQRAHSISVANMLLDRKRRAHGSTATLPTESAETASTGQEKGRKKVGFKSTPLGGAVPEDSPKDSKGNDEHASQHDLGTSGTE
ncbi:hypothetical protein HGRIS_002331 [Hohenbuehelia grisea]|uniref:CNNM transmembrane domain-containing protein n=1 Tax=Hohenbuehelia grisea TaxID=104357 RepID=A0ABR3JM85_9AGAR